MALAGIAAALVAICGFTLHSLGTNGGIRLTGITQLTDDGALMSGLVTDGRTLYFSEYRDGRMELLSLPISGSATQEIRTPFARVIPTDMSVDGQKLLVLAKRGL